MKADHDDMLPEYDFSKGVRGKYTDRLTAAEREASLRRAWPEMVQELSSYTLRQVQGLESALFTFFVLAGHEPVQRAARHAATLLDAKDERGPTGLVAQLRASGLVDPGLLAQLQAISVQRDWVQHPLSGSEADRESAKPVLARLQVIYEQAQALRHRVEQLIEQHLAGEGMSRQEIEQKTEETAKLWLAA
jgi:hypothetical protein